MLRPPIGAEPSAERTALSNAANQGITALPALWPATERAQPSASAGPKAMPDKIVDNDPDEARRFRELALPHLDDVYTLARYLLRDAADADDAVQECYLRALKHFHTYRGPAIKPWLFAILRNVCHAEYKRRAGAHVASDELPERAEQAPIWHEEQETPEAAIVNRYDAGTIRRLIDKLAEPFRETFILREIEELSYREIADVAEVPVGTVMSRLARARAMLRSAWLAEQEKAE